MKWIIQASLPGVEGKGRRDTLQNDGLVLHLRVVSAADAQRGGDAALVLQ